MPNDKRYLIITVGATGSGKSSLQNKTLNYLGVSPDENIEKILVDDLVENDPKYKKKVAEIIAELQELCKKENDLNCLQKKFETPTPELFEKFNNAYFETRKSKGCLGDMNYTCDELTMKNLTYSLQRRKNIIFEFTGQYIPNWLLNLKEILDTDYYIVFSYSLVSLDNLISRNKTRAYNSVISFKNGGPAPRLPNVSKEKFVPTLNLMKKNLIKLYNKCMRDKNVKLCGKKNIDRLLLFDNNKYTTFPVFDSNINKNINEFEIIIDRIIKGKSYEDINEENKDIKDIAFFLIDNKSQRKKRFNISTLTLQEIREIYKMLGLTGYTKFKKGELVKDLNKMINKKKRINNGIKRIRNYNL